MGNPHSIDLRTALVMASLAATVGLGWWYQRANSPTSAVRVGCDVRRDCVARLPDGEMITARFLAPPRKLQPFDLTITSRRPPLFVSFAMRSMDMGFNRFTLQLAQNGAWQGRMALPACVAGRNDWLLQVHFAEGVVEFEFQAE